MGYTVTSSEKLNKSASEMEAKALLYLMNFHEDKDEIHYFIIDFFNDLTGMDRMSNKLWDIQSKGAKNSSPKAIGKELVTLYKNYISDINFENYILFLGGVSSTVRIDSSKNIFGYENINDKALINLKDGLKEECNSKTYIYSSSIDDIKLDSFIKKVIFVVDDKEPTEYIKSIIKVHSGIMPSDETLMAIFNEIKNTQSTKKNSLVEGVTIQTTDQSLNYYRHLTNSEIKMLVLGRIINGNPFNKGCPEPFIPIYNVFPPENRSVALEDCKLSLSRALFNKNNADNFWTLFETIYKTIVENNNSSVEEVFNLLDKRTKSLCPEFDVLSLKYFISTIKGGLDL